MVGKGKILMAFYNYEYLLPLILGFLQVSCNIESETISTIASYSYVKIHGAILRVEWIFYPHHSLAIWKIVLLGVTPFSQGLTDFLKQYHKITFVNITSEFIRKVFKYWEVVWLTVSDTFSFSLENSNFYPQPQLLFAL